MRFPDLGTRGEGWVAMQAILLLGVAGVSFLGSGWPGAWRSPLRVAGSAALVAGAGLVVIGARSLGTALTPLPRPRNAATLREGGIYRFVRHPIYGGLVVLVLGVSLLSSPWALVPSALLALVLVGKSVREERWLVERYPGYTAYRERVRRRFLPFVW